ncbi:unnamed protein product [Linum trigynum]|uniref:Uncharacterized protein n=1 Tax=Linum trigynum TaxID=586398 RepID=A0AAV2CA87_9ROSI
MATIGMGGLAEAYVAGKIYKEKIDRQKAAAAGGRPEDAAAVGGESAAGCFSFWSSKSYSAARSGPGARVCDETVCIR